MNQHNGMPSTIHRKICSRQRPFNATWPRHRSARCSRLMRKFRLDAFLLANNWDILKDFIRGLQNSCREGVIRRTPTKPFEPTSAAPVMPTPEERVAESYEPHVRAGMGINAWPKPCVTFGWPSGDYLDSRSNNTTRSIRPKMPSFQCV